MVLIGLVVRFSCRHRAFNVSEPEEVKDMAAFNRHTESRLPLILVVATPLALFLC